MAALAIATPGACRLRVETSTASVLNRTDSSWGFYEDSVGRFGSDDALTVLWEAPEPFHRKTLDDVAFITRQLERLDGVRRVDSLATIPVLVRDANGELSLESQLSKPSGRGDGPKTHLPSELAKDRIGRGALISDDGQAFAINVLLERNAERHYSELLSQIDHVMAERSYSISGVPIFRVEADRRTREELALFVPLTVVALSILLYAAFGSMLGVVLPLSASAVGTWIAAGTMGAVGRPLTIATILLPSILLANGCAYAVHVLVAGANRAQNDLETPVTSVALPVVLSGATTALGLVSMCVVRIDAISDVGAFGALGVLAVNLAALTLVPAGMRVWGTASPRAPLVRWVGLGVGRAIVRVASTYATPLMVGWSVLAAVMAVGIGRLQVETDVIVWFPDDDPVRVSYEHIRRRLSGISPMNIVVEAPTGKTVTEPDVIRALDQLTAYAESLPEVGRAISIADSLRQLNAVFTQDVSTPLPSEAAEIEQYLLLLDAKNYTHDLITRDRSAANVVMRVNDNASEALLSVAATLEDWWSKHGPEGFAARATGIMFEFGRSEDAIAWGQIAGFVTALVPISLILVATFRSVRFAAIALIPNVVPIALAFGAMGLWGIPLDAGTVVVGCLALGIAIDDTIHVAEGYLTFRPRTISGREALERTFERSLPAVFLTTSVIAIGFLVLAFSDFVLTRNLGLVTTALMVLCLLADLLLFAPLLMRFVDTHHLGKES